MSDAFSSFITEGHQILQTLRDLIKKPFDDPEEHAHTFNEIFRNIHKLKGNAGFLNFYEIEKLCHKIEDIFDVIRSGQAINLQAIRNILPELIEILIKTLNKISFGEGASIPELDICLEAIKSILPKGWNQDKDYTIPPLGKILIDKGVINQEMVEKALKLQRRNLGEILLDMGAINKAELATALSAQQEIKQSIVVTNNYQDILNTKALLSSSISVERNKLKDLTESISNISLRITDLPDHKELNNIKNEIILKVDDTLNILSSLRLHSISSMINKLSKLVQDLAVKLNKKVEFIIEGSEIFLDIDKIDPLNEALMHLVRNALDHGIGTPLERLKAGKNEQGKLILSFTQKNNATLITLKDDGKGLIEDLIRDKAYKMELIKDYNQKLSLDNILDILLLPGFSTKDTVTRTSGRGMGMDIVKNNLEKINGKLSIETVKNQGVTFTVRIPNR